MSGKILASSAFGQQRPVVTLLLIMLLETRCRMVEDGACQGWGELENFMKEGNKIVVAAHRTQRPSSCCPRVLYFPMGGWEEPVPDSCSPHLDKRSLYQYLSCLHHWHWSASECSLAEVWASTYSGPDLDLRTDYSAPRGAYQPTICLLHSGVLVN